MIYGLSKEFLNDYFVESGTYHGDGVQYALDCGFPNVRSIEIDIRLYFESKRRFAAFPNVKLYIGDSTKMMYKCIEDISTNITFWLDGHYMDHNLDTVKSLGFPVMQELEQIQKHHLNTHTILIDDLRIINDKEQFERNGWPFFGIEGIVNKLKEINPDYEIYRIDGVAPSDVLVARPE